MSGPSTEHLATWMRAQLGLAEQLIPDQGWRDQSSAGIRDSLTILGVDLADPAQAHVVLAVAYVTVANCQVYAGLHDSPTLGMVAAWNTVTGAGGAAADALDLAAIEPDRG